MTHQWIIYEIETKNYYNVKHFCLAKKKKKEKMKQANEISFCNLLIKIFKQIISMEMKSMVSLADENAIVKVWVEYMGIK